MINQLMELLDEEYSSKNDKNELLFVFLII